MKNFFKGLALIMIIGGSFTTLYGLQQIFNA